MVAADLASRAFTMVALAMVARATGAWKLWPTQRGPRRSRFHQLARSGASVRWAASFCILIRIAGPLDRPHRPVLAVFFGSGRPRLGRRSRPTRSRVGDAVLTTGNGMKDCSVIIVDDCACRQCTGTIPALWGVEIQLRFEPGRLPRVEEVGVSLPLLGFALGVSLATAVGLGLTSAWRTTGRTLEHSLNGSQRSQLSHDESFVSVTLWSSPSWPSPWCCWWAPVCWAAANGSSLRSTRAFVRKRGW